MKFLFGKKKDKAPPQERPAAPIAAPEELSPAQLEGMREADMDPIDITVMKLDETGREEVALPMNIPHHANIGNLKANLQAEYGFHTSLTQVMRAPGTDGCKNNEHLGLETGDVIYVFVLPLEGEDPQDEVLRQHRELHGQMEDIAADISRVGRS
mmetsp:Transcript_88730/g.153592  ORF Transcript_88730/g.153592 Transcript_88730/m.153592 type:complete len:155 (+) Transcript_88730:111-575(+)